MPYNGEGVQALVCAVENLRNTPLLNTKTSVQRVLKCLAFYEEFKAVLTRASRGFDYQAQMTAACERINNDNFFRLPKSKTDKVALGANLLMDFDREPGTLVTFCNTFYPAANEQESFSFFMQGVMDPFKEALVDLVVNGIEEEHKVVERTVEFASTGVQQQAEHLVGKIYKEVSVASINEAQRSDLIVMLEGFAAALDARDSLMIRAMWLGFKCALDVAKLCKKESAQVDEVLRQYLLS